MQIIGIDRIKEAVKTLDIIPSIAAGFVAYSEGKTVVPPVGELLFHDPPGDVHIKYGYLTGDDYYVIKIASGFYENPKLNLPSGNGLMLLFDQKTGVLLSILLDEGYLTDLRTAAAGAIAATHLAPKSVQRIGIIGTGTQARLQLRHLKQVTNCRDVVACGRDLDKLARYKEEMEQEGFWVTTTLSADDVASNCNLIVTATAATSALLQAHQIQAGTHITAVGADTPEKQELDPAILARADLVVADSLSQCVVRGEIAHALNGGFIQQSELVELGHVISGRHPGRTAEDQITVADLTGVAVQDIQIAKAVYEMVSETAR
jgi:ornithine cyclodeaminase